MDVANKAAAKPLENPDKCYGSRSNAANSSAMYGAIPADKKNKL